jgi:hypothetical protein
MIMVSTWLLTNYFRRSALNFNRVDGQRLYTQQKPRTLGTMSCLSHQPTVHWRGLPGLCNIERSSTYYCTARYNVSFKPSDLFTIVVVRDFLQGYVLRVLDWLADIERNPSGRHLCTALFLGVYRSAHACKFRRKIIHILA